MKRTGAVLLPAFVLAATVTINFSQAQPAGFAVTQRGADWRVLSKTTVENGTNRVHRYTELATGLNYQNGYGQWTESQEQITLLPTGGAAATQGRHKVYFPADIYNGVLEVVTPDGRHLRSRPLGVSYDDGSNTVFIATLKHAPGYLTSSNTVTYRDAFEGIKADLVATYRRGGFECDLVFRQQPATPGDYGLDESFSTLQLVTEFFNTADPEQVPAGHDDWFGLQDSTLKFGKLTMTHGKAFAFKGTNSISPRLLGGAGQGEGAVAVYKSWVHLAGRTFLIESVPLLDIADNLDALPLTASVQKPAAGKLFALRSPSSALRLPAAHDIISDTNQILLAAADFTREPGVVLDYNTIDTDTNDFTFAAGQTYFISGGVNLGGTTTFAGGTVIKFADNLDPNTYYYAGTAGNAVMTCGQINCETGPDRPAVFTSMDDDTVGETISGSSGHPVPLTVPFLCEADQHLNVILTGLRFSYAGVAVMVPVFDANAPVFRDCQFMHCRIGVGGGVGSSLTFVNCLLAGDIGIQNVESDTYVLENVTLANASCNLDIPDVDSSLGQPFGACLYITNTLFAGGQALSSLETAVINAGGSVNDTANADVSGSDFQTAGNANYYLATGSPYRDIGTTGIDADLLSELQTMTTYAPPDGGWPDTNTPDLGYHYPVNEDSNFNGLPDWWEWKYFGNFNHSGTDLDAKGTHNLIYDYQHGLNPKSGFNPIDSYYDFMHVTAFAPCPALSWGFDAANYVQPDEPALANQHYPHDGKPDYSYWPNPNEIDPQGKPMTFYRRRKVTEVYEGWFGSCDASGAFNGSLVTMTFTKIYQAYPYYRNPWNLDQVDIDAQSDSVYPTGAENLNALTDPSHSQDLRVTGYGLDFETTVKVTFNASDNSGVGDFLVLPTHHNNIDGNPLVIWDQALCPPPDVSPTSVTQYYQGAGEQPSQPNAGPFKDVKLASRREDLEDPVTWSEYMNQVDSLLASVSLTPSTLINTREGQLYFDYFGLSAAYPNQNIIPSGANYNFDTKEYSFTVTPDQFYGIQCGPNEAGVPGSLHSTPALATFDVYGASKGAQAWPYYWEPNSEHYHWNRISAPLWWSGNAANSGADLPASCGFVSHDGHVTLHAGKASDPVWQADKNYAVGDRVADANGHAEFCITGGHSSPDTEPVWTTTLGGISQDNTVRWQAVQTPVTAIVSVGHGNQIIAFPLKSGTVVANDYAAPVYPAANGPSRYLFGMYTPDGFFKEKSRVRIPNHPESIMTDVANFLSTAPAIPTTNLLIYSINKYDLSDVTQNKYSDLPAGEYFFGPTDINTPTGYGYLMFDPSAANGLVVDNRDGQITDDDFRTNSLSNPFCFWLNNDHDVNTNMDDYPIQDDSDTGSDANSTVITCTRDLEDYARLWIVKDQLISQELQTGNFLLALEWKNTTANPQIRIFPAYETDGGMQYVTDWETASNQLIAPNGIAVTDQNGLQAVTSTKFFFQPSFWLNPPSDLTSHFLFDAISAGEGQLVVSLYQPDATTKVAESAPLYLRLRDIKNMYERWSVDPNSAENSNGGVIPNSTAHIVSTARPPNGFVYDSNSLEENKYILFVHGWNMSPQDKDHFAETVYKRLWWQGYNGRFGALQWPVTYGFSGDFGDILTNPRNYDNGEFIAWQSATGLLNKLNDLNTAYQGQVYLLAHSMGNVVAGEALRKAGASTPVNTYVAAQAAIPAHVYDSSENIPLHSFDWLGFNWDSGTANVNGFTAQPLAIDSFSDIWPSDPFDNHTYESHPWHSAEFLFSNVEQNKFWGALIGRNGFNLK